MTRSIRRHGRATVALAAAALVLASTAAVAQSPSAPAASLAIPTIPTEKTSLLAPISARAALRAAFGDIHPAATMIDAGLADPRMKIEIEVTARSRST